MRTRSTRLALGAFAVSLAACSVLLDFRPEGQACDPTGGCLPGYACIEGACHASDAGVDPCNGCPAGERCQQGGSPTCVPDVCQTRLCPVGFSCVDAGSGTGCVSIPAPALGHPCSSDLQCQGENPNHFCLMGAVQAASGGGTPRTGVCMERCSSGSTCATTGATCTPLGLGLDAGQIRLCLTPGLVQPCRDDGACQSAGLVCTVFDNTTLGTATLCDAPLPAGAAEGAACKLISAQSVAGELCANGLCLPRSAGTCGQLCDTGSCGAGETCSLVEFSTPGPTRLLPMCLAASTRCQDCTASPSVCGADAPHCTSMGSTSRCLSACLLDAGTQLQCPAGFTCTQQGAGPRCVPDGACP